MLANPAAGLVIKLGHPGTSPVFVPSQKIFGEILRNCGQIQQLALTVEYESCRRPDGDQGAEFLGSLFK